MGPRDCNGNSVRRQGEMEMWNSVLGVHPSSYKMMCLTVGLTHINISQTSKRESAEEGQRREKRCHTSIVCHHHGDLRMTENSWRSGVTGVRRTRQYGGRMQKSEAGRKGMKEVVQKKKRVRETGPTCESHYSDSSSSTTFLLK